MSDDPGYLFLGSKLSEYLEGTKVYLRREVNDAGDLEELDEISLDLAARHEVQPVKLDRQAAKFTITDRAGSILASIAVPTAGDMQLLQHGPDSMPRVAQIMASVTDNTGWTNPPHKQVRFERTFGQGEDMRSEAVRAWAKEQVDALEEVLDAQEPLVRAHNASLVDATKDAVRARRSQLTGSATLRDELGEGI